jgi:hypothetical protein
MAEQLVAAVNPDGSLIGSAGVTGTVTSNAGTSPTNANGWFVRIGDGLDGPANVTPSNFGSCLQVANGTISGGKTLSVVPGNATGTTIDFGASRASCTVVMVVTGTLTGTATLQGSHDGTVFVGTGLAADGGVFTISAAGTFLLWNSNRPFRYYRVNISGAAGTGTADATIMAS